jgi:hypothetical protein
LKTIHDPRTERQLGTDNREIDRLLIGERLEALEIGCRDRSSLRDSGDARIAGRTDQSGDDGLGGEAGGEGMLARAATDDKNPHDVNDLQAERGSRERWADRDYFVDLDRVCA